MKRTNGVLCGVLSCLIAATSVAQEEPTLEPIPMPLPSPRVQGEAAAVNSPHPMRPAVAAGYVQPADGPAFPRETQQLTAPPAAQQPAPFVLDPSPAAASAGSSPALPRAVNRVLPPASRGTYRRPAAVYRSTATTYRRLPQAAVGRTTQVDRIETIETTNRFRPVTFEMRVPTTYVPVRTGNGMAVIRIEEPAEVRPLHIPGQPVRNAIRARRR